MQQTSFHAYTTARRLAGLVDDAALLPAFASSAIEVYPYQIAAARFALCSPYLKGCILCDEGSLGKTYEALLIAVQKWYEGKDRLLLILPPNLIKQWVSQFAFRTLKSQVTEYVGFTNRLPLTPRHSSSIIGPAAATAHTLGKNGTAWIAASSPPVAELL